METVRLATSASDGLIGEYDGSTELCRYQSETHKTQKQLQIEHAQIGFQWKGAGWPNMGRECLPSALQEKHRC
jgi:hypothetical protein